MAAICSRLNKLNGITLVWNTDGKHEITALNDREIVI